MVVRLRLPNIQLSHASELGKSNARRAHPPLLHEFDEWPIPPHLDANSIKILELKEHVFDLGAIVDVRSTPPYTLLPERDADKNPNVLQGNGLGELPEESRDTDLVHPARIASGRAHPVCYERVFELETDESEVAERGEMESFPLLRGRYGHMPSQLRKTDVNM